MHVSLSLRDQLDRDYCTEHICLGTRARHGSHLDMVPAARLALQLGKEAQDFASQERHYGW